MGLISKIRGNKKGSAGFFSSRFALIALSSLTLSSCAMHSNQIHDGGLVISDPFESKNRQVMAFNQAVDRTVIHPVIRGYRTVTPQVARTGVRNFLRNLRSPIIFANQILQGDLPGARDAFLRAAINTAVGFGGLFDVAGYEGIEYEPEDFGQTLAVWGVEPGPYMVLPIIGPSSMRDYAGYFADSMADPLRLHLAHHDNTALYMGKVAADYLDLRDSVMDAQIDLNENSIDSYAAIRSTYYQHRAALIRDENGAFHAAPDIPDYDD